MNILFGNYGNQHLALIQWAIDTQLDDCWVVRVDTGWASGAWQQHVKQVEQLLKKKCVQFEVLVPDYNFSAMVKDRKQFPSKKFQWCAGFLKGLPLIDWLDEYDPCCDATIYLGSRKIDSPLRQDMNSVIESSPHYGDRRVEYPLITSNDEAQYAAIKALGLSPVKYRSDECFPCIHAVPETFSRAEVEDWQRLHDLEQQAGTFMFDRSSVEIRADADSGELQGDSKDLVANLDMGCGSPYACGE